MSTSITKRILWLFVFLWMFVDFVDSVGDINVWGFHGQGYYIEVEIGSPPQKLNVLVDTGSANLAVAAAPLSNVESFFQGNLSSTFKTRGQPVAVTYTQGTWQGVLGSDLVLVPSLHAKRVRCNVALIQKAENFFTNISNWQGILGLGYPVLARPLGRVTSWLSALPLPSAFSLQLGCSSGGNLSSVHGFMEMLQPPFPKSPFRAMIIREWFYEVLVTGIWINDVLMDMPCEEFNNDKSIVDSGTANIRLSTKVFWEAVRMISNSIRGKGINVSNEFWVQEGDICLDVRQISIFPSIALGLAREDGMYFKIVLGPQSYLIRDEYERQTCFYFGLELSDTGTVLGLVSLEGLKVIFDQSGRSISFSNSSCGPPVLLQGPFSCEHDVMDCEHKEIVVSPLTAFSVTSAAFLSVIAVCVGYLACSRFCHHFICPVKSQWPRRSRSRRELLPRSSDLDLTTAT